MGSCLFYYVLRGTILAVLIIYTRYGVRGASVIQNNNVNSKRIGHGIAILIIRGIHQSSVMCHVSYVIVGLKEPKIHLYHVCICGTMYFEVLFFKRCTLYYYMYRMCSTLTKQEYEIKYVDSVKKHVYVLKYKIET